MNFNISFIVQTAIVFVMIMDPFGNIPVFITSLPNKNAKEFRKIVLRESMFALLLMLLSLTIGKWFMALMHVTGSHLQIAGGLVLLIIGLKMIFSTFTRKEEEVFKEPYIVPLAIPLICGPGLIALLATVRQSSEFASFPNCLLATLLAWVVVTSILLSGKFISNIVGEKVLDAMESLMGLLLTCISVSMLINGINAIYGLTEKIAK